MGVDMSNKQPNSCSKDFFPSPSLSLSLAGIFHHGNLYSTANMQIEERDAGTDEHHDNDEARNKSKNKKRKKNHRHTPEQIREMEALFKESPHPDEAQRQELSKRLCLTPKQVKFWFQNRRTQNKTIQERHENSILKAEMEKLRKENRAMRETVDQTLCPNCVANNPCGDPSLTTHKQQSLLIENLKLKSEAEKLRAALEKRSQDRITMDSCRVMPLLEKTKIMEAVNRAMEELSKMATAGEPLWIQSFESRAETLNYNEYSREFSIENPSICERPGQSVEASRETGFFYIDLHRLVKCFMDVNQWKEKFNHIIVKATTLKFLCHGEGVNMNGAVQLVYAELQMLTPMVPAREVCFLRYCRQLSAQKWAVVDVSIDEVEDGMDASSVKCRKRPSGCIIEEISDCRCKVTWVEHLECLNNTLPALYSRLVHSGLAFGARHWMATLQLHCERLAFFSAMDIPQNNITEFVTVAGRKSILLLAQRMTNSFCHAIRASTSQVSGKTGEEIRFVSRKNLDDPGEPLGVILCAVSSVWLPVSPRVLFDFLRDEACRSQWDVFSRGCRAQKMVAIATGQDHGNAVAIQAVKWRRNSKWVLQDSSTNAFESSVVYAPVEISGVQALTNGFNSGDVALLPSGFSILPDGLESPPLPITSGLEEETGGGGTLLTTAFQILFSSSFAAKPTMESVDHVIDLMSTTLRNIKRSLQLE